MWFEDVWITRLAVLARPSRWSASSSGNCRRATRAPILDLRVLKDRGLAASVVLGLVLGFGLYGGTFIYPLFVQNILGFSPTTTGLALLPGGIATGGRRDLSAGASCSGASTRASLIVGGMCHLHVRHVDCWAT